MEELSTEAVCFANAYTAASPCVPSRHTTLTGRNPWMLGCNGNMKFSMGEETTWMSLLRDRGYCCVSVGKTHLVHAGSYHIQVPVARSFCDQQGWDHFHPAPSPQTTKAATFYEGEVHIPLLIRFPDARGAGLRPPYLASNIDLVLTLLDILNVKADVSVPGDSLVPMIDEDRPVRDAVICATSGAMMLRTETAKFWYDHRHGDGEMYDLASDPDELNNLFPDPGHCELRRELVERMLHLRMEDDYRDALPTDRERRIHREVESSYEPDVVTWRLSQKT